MITNTIKVDQKFIKRAGLLFNASLEDILSELLQNSRRAGATRIDITFDEDSVGIVKDNVITIKDNGVGFFSKGTDINLGGTKWNETAQVKEDPAGCGIFSLAHCEKVSVSANNYQVILTPSHFIGVLPYTLHESSVSEGTIISFKHNKQLSAKDCERLCLFASEYLPKDISVYVNDLLVIKRDLFLDAEHIYEWEGLEIGMQLGASRWANCPFINFFGLTVRLKEYKNLLVEYLPDGTHPTICSVSFAINVVDCPQLDLVLPQRKEIVKNDFYYRLVEKLNSLATDYLKHLPDIISTNLSVPVTFTNRLPIINLDYDDNETYSGIYSSNSKIYGVANDDTIYLKDGINKSNAVLICLALEQSGYDLSNVMLVPAGSNLPYVIEDDIEVDLDNYKVTLYYPKGSIELNTNILWTPTYYFDDINSVNIAVNKASINVYEIKEILQCAFFTFNEDGDCYETQEYNFLQDLDDLMPSLMSSTKEEEIETLFLNNCRHFIPSGYSVSIVKTIDGEFTVKATNNNP